MSQVTTERPGRGGQVFRAAPRGDVTALPVLLRGPPRAGPDRDRSDICRSAGAVHAACPAGRTLSMARPRPGRPRRAGLASLVAEILLPPSMPGLLHPASLGACSRAHLDGVVSVHAVEWFLGDAAREQGWQSAAAAVDGTGARSSAPDRDGLSAAYDLARLGHQVEIRDAGADAGGMMALRHPQLQAAGTFGR